MDTRFRPKLGGTSTHSIRIHNIKENEENTCRTWDEPGVEAPLPETLIDRNTMGNSPLGEDPFVHCPSFYWMKGEGPPPVASCKLGASDGNIRVG